MTPDPKSSDASITIELTRTQVEKVIRRGTDGIGVPDVLRGLADRELATRFEGLAESTRLSRSLLLGLTVFAAFPPDGDALAVTDVAGRLGLSPSTTHRYMTTLLAVGLLEQDPRSRRYRVPVTT